MKKPTAALIALAAALAGCATPARAPTPRPTHVPIAPTSTAVTATVVPATSPIDTTIPTPSGTPTGVPTDTPPVPSPTLEPTSTATPTSVSPSPTPAVDPQSDPDGDGYCTYFEQIWGTDPLTFTSFEDLTNHPGTIYARMRVSEPYEFSDMNGALYQVARLINVENNGTPDNATDDHSEFEVVLFPYATYPARDIVTEVARFPVDQANYPAEVRQYLEPTRRSNITQEMRDTLLGVVAGAITDVGAIGRVLDWTRTNFTVMEEPEKGFFFYHELLEFRAGDMFTAREKYWSTTESTLLAAELRAIGIPTRISFAVFVTKEASLRAFGHPSNQVFLNGNWVKLDYTRGFNYPLDDDRDTYSYDYLAVTDIYRDSSEADYATWIYICDYYGDKPPEVYLDLHEPLEMREN